jgi:protein-S-isoprenylcysteine O-methyltransferase Ste14
MKGEVVRKPSAAVGSAVFFVLAPGTAAGLVPWWITDWEIREPLPYWAPARVVGASLIVAGAAVLIHAFARFVVEGLGTPAPVAPPEHLVVGGFYRYVRNPMYVGLLIAIVGQALLFGSWWLLVYAAVGWIVTASFVHWYEEPTLAKQYGDQYEEYRRNVPGWIPRLRPWTGTAERQPRITG